MAEHPRVSEEHEGKPAFEWAVAVLAVLPAATASHGPRIAAAVIIAVTATLTGIIRLVLRDRSPWKVRSVGFDSFIGIALGVGLLATYFSIGMLIG